MENWHIYFFIALAYTQTRFTELMLQTTLYTHWIFHCDRTKHTENGSAQKWFHVYTQQQLPHIFAFDFNYFGEICCCSGVFFSLIPGFLCSCRRIRLNFAQTGCLLVFVSLSGINWWNRYAQPCSRRCDVAHAVRTWKLAHIIWAIHFSWINRRLFGMAEKLASDGSVEMCVWLYHGIRFLEGRAKKWWKRVFNAAHEPSHIRFVYIYCELLQVVSEQFSVSDCLFACLAYIFYGHWIFAHI